MPTYSVTGRSDKGAVLEPLVYLHACMYAYLPIASLGAVIRVPLLSRQVALAAALEHGGQGGDAGAKAELLTAGA